MLYLLNLRSSTAILSFFNSLNQFLLIRDLSNKHKYILFEMPCDKGHASFSFFHETITLNSRMPAKYRRKLAMNRTFPHAAYIVAWAIFCKNHCPQEPIKNWNTTIQLKETKVPTFVCSEIQKLKSSKWVWSQSSEYLNPHAKITEQLINTFNEFKIYVLQLIW